MKDLQEFKDVTDEEDRRNAFDKFVKRQKVSLTFLVSVYEPSFIFSIFDWGECHASTISSWEALSMGR